MSFLKDIGGSGLLGLGGMAAAGPNSAATGLGHLIGTEPSRIASIADSIGKVSNGIATAGGATAGYDAPAPQLSNYMQMMDPRVLKAITDHFGAGASFNPHAMTVDYQ